LKQLKDTNSLLIDVRDNEGGLITLADYIPQLFGVNIAPITGRVLVNKINDLLFQNTFPPDDPWLAEYTRARSTNSTHTLPVAFTTNFEANYVGNAYIKPVGVFTNARCYSSCDIFTANMKDNNIAIVFGEDRVTGGGGANVVKYEGYLTEKGAEVFNELPYADRPNSNDATVAWRQIVRVTNSSRKLIEDYGVNTDYLVRPKVQDLIPNSGSNSQYDFIANELVKFGNKTGRNELYFQASPVFPIEKPVDAPVSLQLDIKGIKTIEIYDTTTNQKVTELRISPDESKSRVQKPILFESLDKLPGLKRFAIKSFDRNNRLVFSTIRQVRFVPDSFLTLQVDEQVALDFMAEYSAIYNDFLNANPGQQVTEWTRSPETLLLANYSNNVDSAISWFINTGEITTVELTVDLTYDTEPDSDFLMLTYTSAFGVQHLLSSYSSSGLYLDGVSGQGSISQTFTLSDLEGSTTISLRFVSDETTTMYGVNVNSLTITGKASDDPWGDDW
jgi:hypothetical protein